MKKFLSCDWGTSNLRIRLFDAHARSISGVESGADGILSTHAGWRAAGADEATREDFYRTVLAAYVTRLQARVEEDLQSLPMIVSGMASSNIGLSPLPYATLPFSLDGFGLQTSTLEATDAFNEIFLISGVRSVNDVMRGEETELVGLAELEKGSGTEQSKYIFPGTHSKHITTAHQHVTGLKTYMTGELFSLLSEKSILCSSIRACEYGSDGTASAFQAGILDSADLDLLHYFFTIRTNELFQVGSPEENYYYLSGLLIGTELNSIGARDSESIVLASQGRLLPLYKTALGILGHENKTRTFSAENVDIAVAVGQYKIYQNND